MDHDANEGSGQGSQREKLLAEELERSRVEHARDMESLRLLDRAVQAVTQGILITDPTQPDNPIIFASPSFEKMTGYSPAESLGQNCRFLQGPDSDPATVQEIRQAINQGRPLTAELLNYRKDGTPFWNELSIAPVHDEDGRLTHFVGVQTDISKRRRLEEQYRQSQKMEAIGRLAGGVAHDFNNLLTVIKGYAQLILEALPESHPMRSAAEQIHLASDRSANLTSQLLAFSRQQVLAPRVLVLNDVVEGFAAILKRALGEEVELKTLLAPDLALVHADPGQLEQVLLNLAINARDSMPKGGKVTIETKNLQLFGHPDLAPGAYVLLTFSDTGTGISPAIRGRIFEPFFTTKERGKGTGLGLAVVHGILRQSSGLIEVESPPGHGTCFKIYLPRLDQKLVVESKEFAQAPDLGGNETILFVEDDDSLRELVCQVLKAEGYKMLVAARGEEALALAEQKEDRIDLLLTDVVMPGMGGRQVAERFLELHPESQVLYISGYTDDTVIRHGIQEEQVNFLQKPFGTHALKKKLREVLA